MPSPSLRTVMAEHRRACEDEAVESARVDALARAQGRTPTRACERYGCWPNRTTGCCNRCNRPAR